MTLGIGQLAEFRQTDRQERAGQCKVGHIPGKGRQSGRKKGHMSAQSRETRKVSKLRAYYMKINFYLNPGNQKLCLQGLSEG